MFVGVIGGLIAGILSHDCTATEYINGLQYDFIPFKALYALIKTVYLHLLLPVFHLFMVFLLKEVH